MNKAELTNDGNKEIGRDTHRFRNSSVLESALGFVHGPLREANVNEMIPTRSQLRIIGSVSHAQWSGVPGC